MIDPDVMAAMRRPVQVEYNRSLPYAEFLKSLYWRYVRSLVFRLWGKRGCRRCRATRVRLDVHHITYEHQGDELNHLEDLVVLCRNCHEHAHEAEYLKIPPVQQVTVPQELIVHWAGRCQQCEDSGWIVTERGAIYCACRSVAA
jgi:hypothetical protein